MNIKLSACNDDSPEPLWSKQDALQTICIDGHMAHNNVFVIICTNKLFHGIASLLIDIPLWNDENLVHNTDFRKHHNA